MALLGLHGQLTQVFLYFPGVLQRRLLVVPVKLADAGQQGLVAGPAVHVILGEVGAAVEDLAPLGEERGERPATLTGDRAHGALVSAVNLGSFVPVDLHGDKPIVDDGRHFLVFVAFTVHYVAPVAPDSADVEQDGFLLLCGQSEGLVAPRMPLDRLVGCAFQIGAGFVSEAVGGHKHCCYLRCELGLTGDQGSRSIVMSPSSRASRVILLPHKRLIPIIVGLSDSTATTLSGSSCQVTLAAYVFITDIPPSANVNVRCPVGLSPRRTMVVVGNEISPEKPVSNTAATA